MFHFITERKEGFPNPTSHFLFKNHNRSSSTVNSELTVVQIIVLFLNFVLDKVEINLLFPNNISEIVFLTLVPGFLDSPFDI